MLRVPYIPKYFEGGDNRRRWAADSSNESLTKREVPITTAVLRFGGQHSSGLSTAVTTHLRSNFEMNNLWPRILSAQFYTNRTASFNLRGPSLHSSHDPVTDFAIKGIIRVTDDIDPRYETGWL
jgi:hypothetical protein